MTIAASTPYSFIHLYIELNVEVQVVSSNETVISWKLPNTHGIDEVKYELRLASLGRIWTYSTTNQNYTLSALLPYTQYGVQVRSFIESRWSDWSDELDFRTFADG